MPATGGRLASGDLRLYGTFQRRTVTRDSHAAAGVAWATYANWFFRVAEQSGGETAYAGKVIGARIYVLEGRPVTGLLRSDRLTWATRTLDIVDIENDDMLAELMRVRCQEAIA